MRIWVSHSNDKEENGNINELNVCRRAHIGWPNWVPSVLAYLKTHGSHTIIHNNATQLPLFFNVSIIILTLPFKVIPCLYHSYVGIINIKLD